MNEWNRLFRLLLPEIEADPRVLTLGAFLVATVALAASIVDLPPAASLGLLAYTRVTRSTLHRQKTRRAILDFLQHCPCLSVSELMAAMGLAEGTVRHHLRLLEKHGHVQSTDAGRHKFYWPAQPDLSEENRESHALLCCERNLAIANAIVQNPGIDQGAVARQVGLSQAQVHARMKQILHHSLANCTKDGRYIKYSITRKGFQVLVEVRRKLRILEGLDTRTSLLSSVPGASEP